MKQWKASKRIDQKETGASKINESPSAKVDGLQNSKLYKTIPERGQTPVLYKCSLSLRARSTSSVSMWLGSGRQQSTGQTAAHCGSS